jgi:tetratricopeptide (TPR) repeat protein
MIKKGSGSSSSKSKGGTETKETMRKLVVLLSMILIGILLIVYRSNYEYWADQFITYNQILFGISLLLLIIILLVFLMDFRNIIKHELLGTIIFFIGALIFMLIPAGNFLGVGGLSENSIALFAAGGVIIAIGSILLMRTGGFVGVCVLSILINTMVSAYHVFGDTSATQYNSNTYLMTNFSILFFIICFILLIYHDLKFFYLASLIKEEKSLRRKKEYKKALSYCEKALLIYPYFATAWNNKGNVLVNMGKKKDAIQCYKRALNINPNYIPAKKNLQQFQGF